jgi:hypothetical protein
MTSATQSVRGQGCVDSHHALPQAKLKASSTNTDLLVTQLDSKSAAMLGYDWLCLNNPIVDWLNSSLAFQSRPLKPGTTPPSPAKLSSTPPVSVSQSHPPNALPMPLQCSSSIPPVSASQSRPLNAVPSPLQWFGSSLVLEASTAIPRLRATTVVVSEHGTMNVGL